MLERLDKYKHPSLLQKFVNYGRRFFITLRPRHSKESATKTEKYFCQNPLKNLFLEVTVYSFVTIRPNQSPIAKSWLWLSSCDFLHG
jgi:hypothetical protein